MRKLSRPGRAWAMMILTIMRLSSGLIRNPSSPLAIAMVMKVRFMDWHAGSQKEMFESAQAMWITDAYFNFFAPRRPFEI